MKKRTDGRYTKPVPVGRSSNGTPIRKFIYGKTIKEVEGKVREYMDQADKGISPVSDKMFFKDLADMWLSMTKTNLVPGTFHMYRTMVNKHLNPRLGGYYVKELKPLHLQGILNNLNDDGYSTKTIRTAKFTANQIMEFAIDNDLILKNPFKRVALPKGSSKKERRALTSEEQDFIFASYKGHRMGVPVLLMMCCGLRRGELIALTWDDVKTDEKYLVINKAAMIDGNKSTVKDPKTASGNRRVPIPGSLLDILVDAKSKASSPYVCPSADGQMMTESAFKRAWDSYEHYLNILAGGKDATRSHPKIVKFPHITPHMFRHTYATMLYDAGVDVKKAQKNLGHADVSTTLQIYTHLSNEKESIADLEFDKFVSEKITKCSQKVVKTAENTK